MNPRLLSNSCANTTCRDFFACGAFGPGDLGIADVYGKVERGLLA